MEKTVLEMLTRIAEYDRVLYQVHMGRLYEALGIPLDRKLNSISLQDVVRKNNAYTEAIKKIKEDYHKLC